ncbi:MAG: RNA 2',3'-cyclic phosphodiesterase [Desulfobacterales bacterium]
MGRNAKNPENRDDSQGQAKTHRAFIAVALPAHVTEALGALQKKLRDFGIRMKYTDPENIHLTLKFLGDIRASDVEAINAQLSAAAAGFSPMTLSAAGLGAFPSIRRPRVLWTGVAGQSQMLEALQQEVENAMAAIGFEKENRRFSGHFTLGRFKGKADADRLAEAIRQFGDFATDEFVADAVHLFESTLTPKGPIYRVLSHHRLEGKDK